MNHAAEIERLRSLRLDHATASLQRKTIRALVWTSVGLVLAGQLLGTSWTYSKAVKELQQLEQFEGVATKRETEYWRVTLPKAEF